MDLKNFFFFWIFSVKITITIKISLSCTFLLQYTWITRYISQEKAAYLEVLISELISRFFSKFIPWCIEGNHEPT